MPAGDSERRVELSRLVRTELTKPDGRRLYLYERRFASKPAPTAPQTERFASKPAPRAPEPKLGR